MSCGNSGAKVGSLVLEIGNCIESEYGVLKAKREVRDLKKAGVPQDYWQSETMKATNAPAANQKAVRALTKKLRQISHLEEWSPEIKVCQLVRCYLLFDFIARFKLAQPCLLI